MSTPCNVESHEKKKIEQVSHAVEFTIWCVSTQQIMSNELEQYDASINNAHDLHDFIDMTVSKALFLSS